MSTPAVPASPAAPLTTEQIAAANAASQNTATPGQPPVAVEPAAPVVTAPTPENPVVVTDLGGGRFKAVHLTGEEFEGAPQEILDKQGRAQVSTKLWARDKVAQAAQPAPTPAPQPQSMFANAEEQAAAEYAAGLVAKSLGYPDALTMRRALGMIQETSSTFAAQNVELQFLTAQPDFNNTKENNEKLLGNIVEAGMGDAFDRATPKQQVQMLRQAHSYLAMNDKSYTVKQAGANPPPPRPIPPVPVGSRPPSTGGIPENLKAVPGDSPQEVMRKWNEAKKLGYDV